jgi:iron(III) transport system substrate-binding protein
MARRMARGAAIIIAVTAALVAGCSSGSQPTSSRSSGSGALVIDGQQVASAKLWSAAKKEGSLTLYSSQNLASLQAIQAAFEKEVPLKLSYVETDTSALYTRILSEYKAGKLGADAFYMGDPSLLAQLKKQGVITPYCFPGLQAVPAQYKVDNCAYWSSELIPIAIAYNTAIVKSSDAPKTWQDLLNPKWRGKIALSAIGAGGSSWAIESYFLEHYGMSFWTKLAAQKPQLTLAPPTAVTAVQNGNVSIAVGVAAGFLGAINQGSPLQIVFPKEGTATLGEWIGLSSTSTHPNAAKVFIQWMASKAGQAAITAGANDWPLTPGAQGPKEKGRALPAISTLNPDDMELNASLTAKQQALTEEWNKIFNFSQ